MPRQPGDDPVEAGAGADRGYLRHARKVLEGVGARHVRLPDRLRDLPSRPLSLGSYLVHVEAGLYLGYCLQEVASLYRFGLCVDGERCWDH